MIDQTSRKISPGGELGTAHHHLDPLSGPPHGHCRRPDVHARESLQNRRDQQTLLAGGHPDIRSLFHQRRQQDRGGRCIESKIEIATGQEILHGSAVSDQGPNRVEPPRDLEIAHEPEAGLTNSLDVFAAVENHALCEVPYDIPGFVDDIEKYFDRLPRPRRPGQQTAAVDLDEDLNRHLFIIRRGAWAGPENGAFEVAPGLTRQQQCCAPSINGGQGSRLDPFDRQTLFRLGFGDLLHIGCSGLALVRCPATGHSMHTRDTEQEGHQQSPDCHRRRAVQNRNPAAAHSIVSPVSLPTSTSTIAVDSDEERSSRILTAIRCGPSCSTMPIMNLASCSTALSRWSFSISMG